MIASVDGVASPEDRAVGAVPGDLPIGSHLDSPASLMNVVMMLGAKRVEHVLVGVAEASPECDVMDVALRVRNPALWLTASGMHRRQTISLTLRSRA